VRSARRGREQPRSGILRTSPSEDPPPSPHLEDERPEALRQWYEREREEAEERTLEDYERNLY